MPVPNKKARKKFSVFVRSLKKMITISIDRLMRVWRFRGTIFNYGGICQRTHNYTQCSPCSEKTVRSWHVAYIVIVGAIVIALCSSTFQSVPRLGWVPWRGSPADRNFYSCATWLASRIESTWRMPARCSIRDGQSSRKSWPPTTFCITFQAILTLTLASYFIFSQSNHKRAVSSSFL